MVNLSEEQPARQVGERENGRGNGTRSHYNWRASSRYGRHSEDTILHSEPIGLLQLEKLAARTVMLMEKHSPRSEHNYQIAMDLLRLQYNLNFIVLCEVCHGQHDNDELVAPER